MDPILTPVTRFTDETREYVARHLQQPEYKAVLDRVMDGMLRRMANIDAEVRCPDCGPEIRRYPDGECQHGYLWAMALDPDPFDYEFMGRQA